MHCKFGCRRGGDLKGVLLIPGTHSILLVSLPLSLSCIHNSDCQPPPTFLPSPVQHPPSLRSAHPLKISMLPPSSSDIGLVCSFDHLVCQSIARFFHIVRLRGGFTHTILNRNHMASLRKPDVSIHMVSPWCKHELIR